MNRVAAAVFAFAAFATPRPGLGQSSVDEFALGGSAFVVSEDCIRRTSDHPYLSGSAWFRQAIDLGRPFEVRLSLVLGTKDRPGADGIVFVLHPTAQTGLAGEGMGFAGLVPSLGVEIDTYRNFHLGDPEADHLAFMVNGNPVHGGGVGIAPVPNLEDGARHPLVIRWNPNANELSVRLDGALQVAYPGERLRAVFAGKQQLYWGMTAATGRLSNVQDICLEMELLAQAQLRFP